MKTFSILGKFLPVFAGLALHSAAEAASIRFYVQVPGYSSAGWIAVRPELRSLLGGKVAYIPQYGGWVTDRVARGEATGTTVLPDRAGETWCRCTVSGWQIPGGSAWYYSNPMGGMYLGVVSTSPSVVAVQAVASTSAGTFAAQVPIGTR